jgi:hypothetical protein
VLEERELLAEPLPEERASEDRFSHELESETLPEDREREDRFETDTEPWRRTRP